MNLSETQRQALEQGMRRPFVERLMTDVRRLYPKSINHVSGDLLRRRIEYGLTRAEQYNMTWQSALAAFVLAMFSAAPHFDEDPRLNAILTDSSVSPELRMRKLLRLTDNNQWREIRENKALAQWPEGLEGAKQ